MSTTEINPTKLLETAMGLVRTAQSNIKATMQASEEMARPLPQEYFLQLLEKMQNGVKIDRVGFGSEKELEPLKDRIHFDHENYNFKRTDASDYRRMLLVDDSKLMFSKTEGGIRHFFFSDDPSVISEYRQFFEAHLTA